jgi:flavin-binding protein dodecin
MGIAKVIEISSSSTDSFEDAIESGIQRATSTMEQVQGAWVKEQKVVVEKGKIVEYRVDLKVTFMLND